MIIHQIIAIILFINLIFVAYFKVYCQTVGGWWRIDGLLRMIFRFFAEYNTPKKDEYSNEVEYYVKKYGFEFELHRVVTEDGFVLKMHRLYRKESLGSSQFSPIILQHGLFQSSGIFVTNEEDSIAFHLANQGFDIWLGNNRGVFPGHEKFKESDSEYWNWGLDEMARYDFSAMINYVCSETNHENLIYIGHSQGNSQAFAGLSLNPELSKKVKLFVALAPAYFIGDLPHWALRFICNLQPQQFGSLFGTCCFFPIMNVIQQRLPARVFSSLAYPMFSHLFQWGDTHWEPSRKPKYFTFTPRPLSCRLLMQWGKISRAGKLVQYEEGAHYSLQNIQCPLAVFYGGRDSLVSGRQLIEELKNNEILIHAEEIPHYEHMDLLWATDAPRFVFSKLFDLLNRTRIPPAGHTPCVLENPETVT